MLAALRRRVRLGLVACVVAGLVAGGIARFDIGLPRAHADEQLNELAYNIWTQLGGGGSTVSTGALAANLVVDANPGRLYSFNVSADATLSGAAWWIMIYDLAAAPSDGAVTPKKCYAMASGVTSYSAAFFAPPSFAAGIVVGVSTTGCFTKTASTHAFISGDYK